MKGKRADRILTRADYRLAGRIKCQVDVDVDLHCWIRNYAAAETRRRKKAGLPGVVTAGSLYDAAIRMLQAEIIRRRSLVADRAAPGKVRGFRSGGSSAG